MSQTKNNPSQALSHQTAGDAEQDRNHKTDEGKSSFSARTNWLGELSERHILEQHYQYLFDESPAMLVITRVHEGEGYVEDCNSLFLKTLGYEKDDAVGRPLADFYSGDSRAALGPEGGYRLALESGVIDVERTLVRRDGSHVQTIMRASPIVGADGKAWGTHAAYIDISARKAAEEALRQSEARLRQTLEAAHMGAWEWDISEQTVNWSDKSNALFGREAGEEPGNYQSYIDLIHPDDRQRLEADIRQALVTGEYAATNRIIWPDGTTHWLEAKGRVEFDDDGNPRRLHGTVMDVTQRLTAEEELRRSREQLAITLENAPSYILTLDRDGIILTVNRVPEGFSVDNVIGRHIDAVATTTDSERPRRAFQRVLETGQPVHYVATSNFVNGIDRHYEVRLGPVVVDGEITQVIFVANDITEQVQAEDQLRQFRVALDSSADAILLIDAATYQILDANHSAYRSLGYSREEMLQMSAMDLLPDAKLAEALAILNPIIEGVVPVGVMEIYANAKDGSRVPVELNCRIHATQDGITLVVSGRDIRDRKLAEAALEQDRALLAERVEMRTAELAEQTRELRRVTELQNAILTYGGTAILSTDIHGVIQTFNQAAEQMSNLSAHDVIGKMVPFTDNAKRIITLELVDDLAAQGIALDTIPMPNSGVNGVPFEWTYSRRDGVRIPLLLSITSLEDEAGKPIGYVSMANDISLRKQSEEALRRSEDTLRTANAELARALRLKDEFLANMSHELRTPLNAILNLSESLAEEDAGPLSDKQQSYCQLIMESGQHLLSLINDILDLSRIESGRTSLDLAEVALEPVCQSSMRMVAEQAKKKRITTSIQIDERARWVEADARQLKQMLVNLLGNAVKFTQQGGEIGLDVNVDADAECISLTVWDTGIGVTSEDLQRLFQPFVQVDGGLSRQYGGSGLGLVLVARMARLHGGGVSVESMASQGSRFTINLPWSSERSSSLQPQHDGEGDNGSASHAHDTAVQPEHGENASPHILFVDDNDPLMTSLVGTLENHGYRVTTAYSGQSAVVQARLSKPDLILMDMHMPDIDSHEAVQWLRSEPETEMIPIIGLSALERPGDRERCMEHGIAAYFTKPVDRKRLVREIERLVKSSVTER